MATRQPSVAGVVLAAGDSRRLGSFKPLLPWPSLHSAETLVAYQVRELRAAGVAPVVVVTGTRAEEVASAAGAAGALATYNPEHAAEKATSVRAGVRVTPSGVHLLIVGVDQPRPSWLYRLLVQAARDHTSILLPTYRGRRGHPPLFAASLRDELLTVREETAGMRAVVQRHADRVQPVEMDSPLVLINLNTPDDLVAARATFAELAAAPPATSVR